MGMAGFLRLRFKDSSNALLPGKLHQPHWLISLLLKESQRPIMELLTLRLTKQMPMLSHQMPSKQMLTLNHPTLSKPMPMLNLLTKQTDAYVDPNAAQTDGYADTKAEQIDGSYSDDSAPVKITQETYTDDNAKLVSDNSDGYAEEKTADIVEETKTAPY